jgi:RimJ/RimL family protein N-acetyltransferase
MQVTIRPFKSSDASNLQRAVLGSVGHVGQWLEWCTPRYTLSSARSWLQESKSLWVEGTAHRWAIVPAVALPECSNQILGCVEIRVPRPEAPEGRMGYWVTREVLGRGACTQAAVQALQWGFEQLNLERVELLIQPDNEASIAVAKKLGATFQERLEGAIAFHDQRKAADLYAVTAAQLCQINPVKTRRSWPTSVEYLRKA